MTVDKSDEGVTSEEIIDEESDTTENTDDTDEGSDEGSDEGAGVDVEALMASHATEIAALNSQIVDLTAALDAAINETASVKAELYDRFKSGVTPGEDATTEDDGPEVDDLFEEN